MASRKEQKEKAKAQRVAADAKAQTKRRGQNRVRAIAVAAGLAVLAVIVLIVASQGTDKGGDAGDVSGVAEVNESIGDLPQEGLVLGDPEAKVTITEFGDLQCPACKNFAEAELPAVIADLVEPGQARIVFKNLVIIGPESATAAKAALAASEQDRYWQFVELFYRNQGIENSGYVTDDFLEAVAEAAGVEDVDEWNADRRKARWDRDLDRVRAEARRLGISGTPSFQVEGPNGQTAVPANSSAGAIEDAVDQVR